MSVVLGAAVTRTGELEADGVGETEMIVAVEYLIDEGNNLVTEAGPWGPLEDLKPGFPVGIAAEGY